jgi:hypothetical protein
MQAWKKFGRRELSAQFNHQTAQLDAILPILVEVPPAQFSAASNSGNHA